MKPVPGRDAFYLFDETPAQLRHTLKIIEMRSPAGDDPLRLGQLRDHVGSRLRHIPAMRRKVAFAPRPFFRAIWFDPGLPEVGRLIDEVDLPFPGRRDDLNRLASDLMAGMLDRELPLWKLWLVNGLEGGRQALIFKVHHAVADGAASRRILEQLFSATNDDDDRREDSAPDGEVRPRRRSLVGAAITADATVPGRVGRSLKPFMNSLREASALKRRGITEAPLLAGPPVVWNAMPTTARTIGTVSVPLASVAAIREQQACSSSDVLLSAVAGAVRRYLGDDVPDVPLTANVPMNRVPESVELGGNTTTSFGVMLPTNVAGPLERIELVKTALAHARQHHQAIDYRYWKALCEFYPLYRASTRVGLAIGARRGRALYGLIVTSVPGPRIPLSIGTSELESIYSVGPVVDDIGLNVTAWSYRHSLHITASGCPEHVSSADSFLADIVTEIDALAALGAAGT
ncbi:MAG TPA: wax ester/triacylglycerol synthase domain-containing protein [Acidimicrobiales bacterium]|jgi:diacylglycerol O-acyltransferase|nr:wax ester/triacylglycerol synthase domain-containing protein [Acidimicrobiales bacterium]